MIYTGGPVGAYMEHLCMRDCSPRTLYTRARLLRRVEDSLGKPLLEATEDDVLAWYRGLIDKVAPQTRGNYLTGLHAFYVWAQCGRLIDRPPTAALPRPKVRRRLPRPIPEERLGQAIALAPADVRGMLVLAAFAGLRAMEIAALTAEDVGQDGIVVHGKGGKIRVVPIHPFVAAELRRLPHRGPLFHYRSELEERSARAVSGGYVSQLCNRYLHEAGFAESLHQLRHRFGSSLYRLTHDIRLVQEMLGHESIITTQGYVAWDRPGARAAVGEIPVPA